MSRRAPPWGGRRVVRRCPALLRGERFQPSYPQVPLYGSETESGMLWGQCGAAHGGRGQQKDDPPLPLSLGTPLAGSATDLGTINLNGKEVSMHVLISVGLIEVTFSWP